MRLWWSSESTNKRAGDQTSSTDKSKEVTPDIPPEMGQRWLSGVTHLPTQAQTPFFILDLYELDFWISCQATTHTAYLLTQDT